MVNYEESLESRIPILAKEWHPTKNGELKPSDVTSGSEKSVWWYKPYDDPKTGKHFDFEWEATVNNRTNGVGCPFISGKKVWPGFNDLETTNPDLAKEWNPTKNGELKPSNVTSGSEKSVWWYKPYDDPKTGKHFDFEWEAAIEKRASTGGNPFIAGQRAWPGFNDLETTNPDLAKEWHPTKNGELKPSNVTRRSGKRVWWYQSYDDPKTGKHFDFEWEATINERTSSGGNPFIAGQRVWPGFNDLESLNPYYLADWDYEKNKRIEPKELTIKSGKKVWWRCNICGYTWRSTVHKQAVSCGCKKCNKNI